MALTNVLGYLHTRRPPVIFRDLKPANIMLTRTGRVYLIDFGIARRFAPEKQRDTGPLGSPGYAAPEQYGTAQTDARSDMYALGATLQTLITGRDPLELRQGLPSRRTKPLPAELAALIASMLEVDPKKRPRQITLIGHAPRLVGVALARSPFASPGRVHWPLFLDLVRAALLGRRCYQADRLFPCRGHAIQGESLSDDPQ